MMRIRLQHFFQRLTRAARRAGQHRLLLLWLIAIGIPALLLATPMYLLFAARLNHSIDAASIASKLDFRVLIDLPGVAFAFPEAISAASISSLMVGFFMYAWLNGLAVGASRIKPGSNFSSLIAAANAQYWRMFRLGLWSLVPIGIALAIASAVGQSIDHAKAEAVVASSLDAASHLHLLFTLLLVAMAQCSVEMARAFLAIDPRRRSAVRSWWHGLLMLLRHPIALFGVWLVPSVCSMVLAALLMLVRLNIDQGSAFGLLSAFLLAELVVVWMALMRITRLYALIETVNELRLR
jgi:hypothetical protein